MSFSKVFFFAPKHIRNFSVTVTAYLCLGIYMNTGTIEYWASRLSSCCFLAPFQKQYSPTLMAGKDLYVLSVVMKASFPLFDVLRSDYVFQCSSLLITEFHDL